MLVVFLRTIMLYVVIIFAVRLMGKRQLGELAPSELVVTILISNIVTLPIEDTATPMLLGVIPILTLVCLEVIASAITMKSRKLRRIASGSPKIIISNGKINQKQLKELRFTVDDVLEALRSQGVFDIEKVQYAIIETTGAVSAYLKPQEQPLTMASLEEKDENSNPPQVVIDDGDVIYKSLEFLSLSEEWLCRVLESEDKRACDIFLMTANADKSYYIVDKEKGI
ncbi:MAG: DUF421 domain-containing protein [Oscillospiraceae bacterium]|nr:DUF421 domain-containing protein [Oscillospiraceae bacterium]